MSEQVIKAEEEKADGEEAQAEGGGEDGDRMVYVKLERPLGAHAAGECIAVNEKLAEHLIADGHATEASEEDVQQELTGDDSEEEQEEMPELVSNSLSKLEKKVEEATAKAVAKGLGKTQRRLTVPAEVAQPIYKSEAAYLADAIRVLTGYVPRGKTLSELRQKTRAHEERSVCKSYGTDAYGELIQKAPPLGIQEGSNAAGGYLVNPQFSPDVYVIDHNQLNLQDKCKLVPATSNVYNYRSINESSLANGSIFGGVNMVATAEGASFTSSLPAWTNVAFTLQKFVTFVYFTVEELQDAAYPVESLVNEYVNKAFLYGLNTQIVQGSTLEGLNNNPGTVTVTASGNDTAWHTTPSTNITYADLAGIWASVYPDAKASPGGVWLYHPSLENPLSQMTYTFNGTVPAWSLMYNAENGRDGVTNAPTSPLKIFGKPAYPCWAMSAPGASGSIGYYNFGSVTCYRKDFRVERSTEFQFNTDQVAVRFAARLDVKGMFRNKVTGPNGSQQFGDYVILGASGT